MSWGFFALALVIAYVLQTALVGAFHVQSIDLFLLLALVFGLSAPVHDARIGAWVIGFVQDLGSADPLGIHAFALGVTALVVTALRELVNLNLWWVRLLVGFPAAWAGASIYLLHLHLWQGAASASWAALLGSSVWTALFAALCAALITGNPYMVGRRRRRRHFRPAHR